MLKGQVGLDSCWEERMQETKGVEESLKFSQDLNDDMFHQFKGLIKNSSVFLLLLLYSY